MTRFVFVRHGHPDYSPLKGKGFRGHGNDLAFLSEEGIRQAEAVARDVRLSGAELIISSPYTRTLQTAFLISDTLEVKVSGETDLHEWLPDLSYGYRGQGALLVRYGLAKIEFRGGGSSGGGGRFEPLTGTRKRLVGVLGKYSGYSKVIVVTHGGVMYSVWRRRFGYCEIAEMDFNGETSEYTTY